MSGKDNKSMDAPITHDVDMQGQSPPLVGDITFEETPSGYEVWYSDRIANDHPDLVDESADWLENEMGVLNLGQIDHNFLAADGVLTNEVKEGLIAWWLVRVESLDVRVSHGG